MLFKYFLISLKYSIIWLYVYFQYISISNDISLKKQLKKQISRFFNIIFSPKTDENNIF